MKLAERGPSPPPTLLVSRIWKESLVAGARAGHLGKSGFRTPPIG